MVADLFEGQDHLQHKPLPLEKRLSVSTFKAFNLSHNHLHGLFIQCSLLFGQQSKLILFHLVGQIRDNTFIRLHAAHHER